LELQAEVHTAVQTVVNDVRAAGHEIHKEMIDMASQEAWLGKGITMYEQVRRVLLREAAVRVALKEVADSAGSWGKIGEARFAAASTGDVNFDVMVAKATMAFNSDTVMYVCGVNSYKREGLNLVLSLSSLGESFEIRVHRNASVAHVAGMIGVTLRPVVPGKTPKVQLVGPAGTLLPCRKTIGDALDYESEKVQPDNENCVFYPLSVVTGEEWKQMELCGSTRWMHLRGDEFRDIFGMSKDTFDKLPSWKQIHLKRKHGLF